jgi:hypothetical protein
MEKDGSPDNKSWIGLMFILLLVAFVAFFKFFKKDEDSRDEEELISMRQRENILRYLENGNQKKLLRIEELNRNMPLYIRVLFVVTLFAVDCCVYKFSIDSIATLTQILKDITVWNATFLTLFICFAFLTQGKIVKIEDIVAYINEKIKDKWFEYFFTKADSRINSSNWYKEDIAKIGKEIKQKEEKIKTK